ncbi:MAG: N-acetyltransferase [Chloroflexi bacterium]|nr:N-acetyltransferase [Chloroflexota bacterium]
MATDTLDLLARYDGDERFFATFPGLRREAFPHLVRQVDLIGRSGSVIYSRLSAENAEAAIAKQIAYFQSCGREFEWKAYAHDQPPDLVQRLCAHGFDPDEQEAILVLDLQHPPAELLAPTPIVRRLHRLDQLPEVSAIRQKVRGDQVVERLAYEMEHAPEYLSVYVAYADAAPAACGWTRFPRGSAFASLWGGSTLPELRSRGLYSALLAARVQEARQRGWRFVTVDAGQMSRPILEKRGFRLLTYATACKWHG